jgi:hypothetical protein
MTDSRPHWANVLWERYEYHINRFLTAQELGDPESADFHTAIASELIDILEELGQVVR